MVIAVDFDGTIVKHKYPYTGDEIGRAVEILKELRTLGHKLILWSCRCGYGLEVALGWCEERGLIFDAVNSNILETPGLAVPMIVADIYIDDRNSDWRLKGKSDFTAEKWEAIYDQFRRLIN